MDRSTYGEVDPSEQYQYKPFQLTKKDKPAPGCECLTIHLKFKFFWQIGQVTWCSCFGIFFSLADSRRARVGAGVKDVTFFV